MSETFGGESFDRGSEAQREISRGMLLFDEFGLSESKEDITGRLRKFKTDDDRAKYLRSVEKAALTVFSDNQLEERGITPRDIIPHVLGFRDPDSAVDAAKRLYGDAFPEKIQTLEDLFPQKDDFREIDFEYLNNLAEIKDYLKEFHIDEDYLQRIGKIMQGREDPLSYGTEVLDAIYFAHEIFNKDKDALDQALQGNNPEALARAMFRIDVIAEGDETLAKELRGYIVRSDQSIFLESSYLQASLELKKRGLSVADIGAYEFNHFASYILYDNKGNINTDEIDSFCDNQLLEVQFKRAYERYLHPVKKTGAPFAAHDEDKPKLSDIPKLEAFFKNLGIDPETASLMFASWSTYDAIRKGDEDPFGFVSDKQIYWIQVDAIENILKKVRSLKEVEHYYGKDELREIIEVFGILNFHRYPIDQLHFQLQEWKSGAIPPSHIVITGLHDWNGAIDNSNWGIIYSLMGDSGIYFFEAGSAAQIAKIAVAVGNRERANGRDPLKTNSVENVIIAGHGNPDDLELGLNGEKISVQDFKDSQKKRGKIRARLNTYKKHLGNKFRIILHSCETGGKSEKNDSNIADSISKTHDVQVDAPDSVVSGIQINPDGKVLYIKNENGEYGFVTSKTFTPR